MNAQDLTSLQELDPFAFEDFVKRVFERMGYEVDVTNRSGDEGVDLILQRGDERSIAQCKRYRGQVGQSAIRDFYGTVMHEKAKRGYLVTTGTFSMPSQTWAQGKSLILVDGADLLDSLRGLDIEVQPPLSPKKLGFSLDELVDALSAATASVEQEDYALVLLLFVGKPPKPYTYKHLISALDHLWGSAEWLRGGPGDSRQGKVVGISARDANRLGELRNTLHALPFRDLVFIDGCPKRAASELLLDAFTGSLLLKKPFGYAMPFNLAFGLWENADVRRVMPSSKQAVRELEAVWEETGRIWLEVPVDALDWGDLVRSLTGVPLAPGERFGAETGQATTLDDTETVLRRMRDDGLITSEEYEEKRRKLVEEI